MFNRIINGFKMSEEASMQDVAIAYGVAAFLLARII